MPEKTWISTFDISMSFYKIMPICSMKWDISVDSNVSNEKSLTLIMMFDIEMGLFWCLILKCNYKLNHFILDDKVEKKTPTSSGLHQ